MAFSITETLKTKHSKASATSIVNHVIHNPHAIQELMSCFYSKEKITCQRASWPLGMLGEKSPHLIMPYTIELLAIIKSDNPSDTVVRNILRTWKEMNFEEDVEGEIFDEAFRLFMDTKQAIAIRVFSMYICVNITHKYPELADELIPEIELNLTHDSPAIRSSSKQSLLKLHKLKKNLG